MNYEKCRQQIAKQYKDKIQQLKDENERYLQLYLQEKDKNTALEEELRVKNEWIERLLEFTELTPEQIQGHVKRLEALEAVSKMTSSFARFLNIP